jgi:hypothetical protein
VDLIVSQVHGVHSNRTKQWLGVTIAPFAEGLSRLLDKHLKPKSRAALHQARLSEQQWRDLGKVMNGFRNGRAKKLGKEVLLTVREGNCTDASSARGRLAALSQSKLAELAILRDKLVPKSITKLAKHVMTQRLKQQRPQDQSAVDIWRGMFEPAVLALMCGNATAVVQSERPHWGAASIPSRRLEDAHDVFVDDFHTGLRQLHAELARRFQEGSGERRLQAVDITVEAQTDAWANPELNGMEMGLSLASVCTLLSFEVLLHLEFFVDNFYMPWWAWLLIMLPTEGLGVTTCIIGFSRYCQMILGALGVHLVEGTMGLIYYER